MSAKTAATVKMNSDPRDASGRNGKTGRECLGLEHAAAVKRSLRGICHGLSEYSFANLYLFRGKHEYEIQVDDHVSIYGKTYDDHRYVMPLFDISKMDREYLVSLTDGVHFIFPVHEHTVNLCAEGLFTSSYNPDDSDYVHVSGKFTSYPGSHLRGKKSLAVRFSREHAPLWRPLDGSCRDDAVSVLKQWQERAGAFPESTDYLPCLEALMLREELDLFGFVYYADDMPCGFIIAEELTSEMCVLHFYKGNREFKGIYEYMFQHFASRYANQYRYFNFEQDLGMPGLKTAKAQYAPDHLLKKYRVKLCR